MLITVEVKEGQISEEVMSFLRKHENNEVEIVKIKTDEQINIEKLANEIAELIYFMYVGDDSYTSEDRDADKITLSEKYKLTELQVLKEILEILTEMRISRKIKIKYKFEVTDNNFYINVSWCKQNSKEDVNKLEDIVNEVRKKYEVRNDLVLLK